MPLLPPTVSFPEPGEFLRFYDIQTRRTKFLQLVDVRLPLIYPIRLGSAASGATTVRTILNDLNPSASLSHRYMAFIGVHPGAYYRVYHPFDFEQLDLDGKPQNITFDMSRRLSYAESPYDRPTYSIWIENDRYPAVEAINVMERSSVPEILVILAKYRVKEESKAGVAPENIIDDATLGKLQSGVLSSIPVQFGGDV